LNAARVRPAGDAPYRTAVCVPLPDAEAERASAERMYQLADARLVV